MKTYEAKRLGNELRSTKPLSGVSPYSLSTSKAQRRQQERGVSRERPGCPCRGVIWVAFAGERPHFVSGTRHGSRCVISLPSRKKPLPAKRSNPLTSHKEPPTGAGITAPTLNSHSAQTKPARPPSIANQTQALIKQPLRIHSSKAENMKSIPASSACSEVGYCPPPTFSPSM